MLALALASIDSSSARSQAAAPADAGAAVADPAAEDLEGDLAAPIAPEASPLPPADDRDARDAWLQLRLGTLVGSHPELGPARFGVVVVDIASGKTLFSRDGDAPFNLASNTKVLTAAAALARLGPDFRWRTTAYAEKWNPDTGTIEGDLFLRGRGDPTLRSVDLRTLAHDLAMAGVTDIDGQVVFDTSYFDNVVEPPHFAEQPKERAGFRAPIGSLSIDGNSIVVVVEPDTMGLLPAKVYLEPTVGDYVLIKVNEVATVTEGRTRIRVETLVKKDQIELEVTGQIRHDGGPEWIRRRIDDPLRFAGEVMKRMLAAEGIRLGKKKIGRDLVPTKAIAMAWRESAPLGEIVRTMNKISNNFYAETVLKTLGAEMVASVAVPPRAATWDDGLAELRRYLIEDAGLEDGSFRVGNGSGLFASSDFSPAQMAAVLEAAWKDFRVGPDLAASLAVMGMDGTVRRRLATTPARGRARVKTGTLAAVSTLAGYIAVDTRRPLAFAVLVNDIPDGARAHARALQDQVVAACVAYLGGE